MGWTKMNVDAAFSRSTGSGSAAIVCRDSNGHLLTVSSNTRKVSYLLEAEAHALKEAGVVNELTRQGFGLDAKEANSVAHDLAKLVASNPLCSASINNLPDTITKSIISKANRVEDRRRRRKS
ncbi:hypothetical protein PIB30_009648 [Stylosanthes scabra]|uniref:RNase H type-1 domain-containing protein n=1 Tax=Stylosanthes scabra TaxID=79078 RepID=A0ABU6T7D1_9FABA|nr:hypothetical protein [Stylosanthes scabra]